MARASEERLVSDADEARPRSGRALSLLRHAVDWTVAVLFFALVALAAVPMGGNRDWAWAPIAVIVGLMAVAVAAGAGSRGGFEVHAAERRPLIALIACFAAFVLFGLFQMSTLAPLSGSAWLYEAATRILGKAHAPVPDLAIDAARNALLKILTCGAIFLIARSLCRDRARARLLLLIFVAGVALVVLYAFVAQVTTHSCYVGSYLKKAGDYNAPYDWCAMSGTFASSNSFGSYCGMGIVAAMALTFAGRRRRAEMPYGFDEEEQDGLLASLTGFRVSMLAISLFFLGGLLFSASRAGFAATVASAGMLAFLMMRGRWRARPDLVRLFVVVAVIVVVVILIAGGTILQKAIGASDSYNRVVIWMTSLEAVGLSPWLGWGLGSYADIYAILQPISIPLPNDLAHSTPLETVVEVGVVAAGVGFAIVLIPWGVSLYGALFRRRTRRYLPGAAFCVSAVPILHSMIDFSLQMPAIAFVVSAVLGMGWTQAFGRRQSEGADFAPWA
ncbi:O-antigen ligase family protein [Reyranella sp.]|uniref:O-antigen ligase family protein n=1 Tax=Reyranella sp. TaxID=1929291 RepID=UPI003BAB73E5